MNNFKMSIELKINESNIDMIEQHTAELYDAGAIPREDIERLFDIFLCVRTGCSSLDELRQYALDWIGGK